MNDETVRMIGGNVVVRAYQGGGNVLNAYEVLYQATGWSMIQTEAIVERSCKELGVDFYAVMKELQNQLNDRRSAR